jgi:hypothetical protein
MVTIFDIINRLSVSFRSCFGYVNVLVSEILILDFLHMCLVLLGCAVERPHESLLASRVLLQQRKTKLRVTKEVKTGKVADRGTASQLGNCRNYTIISPVRL